MRIYIVFEDANVYGETRRIRVPEEVENDLAAALYGQAGKVGAIAARLKATHESAEVLARPYEKRTQLLLELADKVSEHTGA